MDISIRSLRIFVFLVSLFLFLQTLSLWAQESAAPRTSAATAAAAEPQPVGLIASSPSQVVPALPVPRLIKVSGMSKDATGLPRTGVVGITFSIYASQEGGTPLWMETQNMELDGHGHYNALLGSSRSDGVPLDLFATGEPRWLGAKVELPGEVEQPRVLMVSVPYALKASDADTVGGMPPSAFVLAPTASGASVSSTAGVAHSARLQGAKSDAKSAITDTGTTNYIPVFTDNSGDVANSIIYQSTSGNIGIGFNNPNNAKVVIVGSSGGAVLNASNDVDTDFYIDLTAPGSSTPYTQFGPGTGSNLALGVGGQAKVWIQNNGEVGINTTTPNAMFDVEGAAASANVGLIATGVYDGIQGYGNTDVGGYFGGSYGGIYAYTNTDTSGYAGVFGFEFGGSTENFGVYGGSSSLVGVGTYGEADGSSNEGGVLAGGLPFGVWGDTAATNGVGIFASADDGYALAAFNNSPSGFTTAVFENDQSTSGTDLVLETYGTNFGPGICNIDAAGSLACTGSKSAVVPVDGGSRKVALYAIEGPENWFEDAGGAQLSGGEAVVNLEHVFGQTVNTDMDYRVFLTPNGDCKGLYVAQKSATSFVVRELGGGTSNIAFDYRIMAKRKGFEQVRLADKTEIFSSKNRPTRRAGSKVQRMPSADEIRKRVEKHAHAPKPGSVAQVMPTIHHNNLNQKR